MNRIHVVFARARLIGALAVAAACGAGGSPGYGTTAPSGGTAGQAPTVTVATDPRLGGHLVDGKGRSLYYFAKDVPAGGTRPAVSNCDAGCLAVWPVFDADPAIAQGIAQTDVGQITRSDGSRQTTYQGFPLYYYAGDTAAGDTRGEGVGGIWYVAHDPSYSITLLSKKDETATYLTDGAGRALYAFDKDTVGTPAAPPVTACTSAACMTSWPTFVADPITAPSDLAAADLTVYTRADGMRQSAYRGHPLYYFAGDAAPGETNGRSVPNWRTINPTSP